MIRLLLFLCTATTIGASSSLLADETVQAPPNSPPVLTLSADEETYVRVLSQCSDLIDAAVSDFERDGDITSSASRINAAAVLYARQQGFELYVDGIRRNIADAPTTNVPSRFLSTHDYYSKGLQALLNTFYVLNNSPRPKVPTTNRNIRVENGLSLIDRAWDEVAKISSVTRTPRPRLTVAKELPDIIPLSSAPIPLKFPERPSPKLPITFNQQVSSYMNTINRSNSTYELLQLSAAWRLSSFDPRLSPFQQVIFSSLSDWANNKRLLLNGLLSPMMYGALKDAYTMRISIMK